MNDREMHTRTRGIRLRPGESPLQEVVHGLRGQECTRWRLRPGSAILLDFGPLIPLYANQPSRSPVRERGAWHVVGWMADVQIRSPSGEVLDSRKLDDDAMTRQMPALLGAKVAQVEVSPAKRTLTIALDNGCTILIAPAPEAEPDEDIWSLFSPERCTFTACADGRWELLSG